MLPLHHWAHNFTVEPDDIDYLNNLLLEKETPLSSEELTHALIQNRLQEELARFEARYKDALVYNPANTYAVGQKLVFPANNYATAVITAIRPGYNPEYGTFDVASVRFEGENRTREFAINLTTPHKLSQQAENDGGLLAATDILTVDDIMREVGDDLIETVEQFLAEQSDLVVVARRWFPRDLILEVNEGHLNLAEAVLDLAEGGPLSTEDILQQIGGIGSSPLSLQVFSMNFALNQDQRFDEVGPAGEVLWYLTRMEPQEVQSVPALLRHTPIEYDRSLLDEQLLALEQEICDELSPLEPIKGAKMGTVTLIYPHRRAGTLPLNAQIRHIFPSARRTSRIWITLVDEQDGEEFNGWVIPGEHYVFGMSPIYRKYSLPIGAHVTVSQAKAPGKILVTLHTYRPRTEWIRLITPKNDQITFENNRRSIGVDFDELVILGVDNLDALDTLVKSTQQQRRSLAAILRMVIPELGKLTPQGTAHVKTIYSAVNVIRRCPPGPIMAMLRANPDFEDVGGHYWRLAE